jgi:hypothetical protein
MEKEKTASKDDNKDATSVQVMAQKVQKKAWKDVYLKKTI